MLEAGLTSRRWGEVRAAELSASWWLCERSIVRQPFASLGLSYLNLLSCAFSRMKRPSCRRVRP